jgi:hypothetical protein
MFRKAIITLLALATSATTVAWIASYQRSPGTRVLRYEPTPGREIDVYLNRGSFLVQYVRDVPSPEIWSRGFAAWGLECRIGGGDRRHHRPGYARFARVASPFWLPFVLFAACPTLAFVRGPLRRYRRRRRNQCVACGYSLIGNLSGTCPECGKSA